MFKSARVKLTLFYLAILVVFSLVITSSIRLLAEREYLHSNMVQRGEVHRLLYGYYRQPSSDNPFIDVQEDQAAQVRQELNQDMLLINIIALGISGLLAYWFAGRTLEPIEKAHLAQARFAADASHELRTPLTNIRLENEVFLRQKHFSEPEARELIASNLEEVQRLEHLSADLLALTQYGSASLKLKSIQVAAVVDEAVKQLRKTAEAKQVRFAARPAPAVVVGHRESLVQLVVILLDNAIKYGPKGGEVTIGGKPEDNHYLLWVQDEGPGIAAADLPHIFDRLYRGDKARSSSTAGFGLGLSLARAIAKANNAELRAENLPGGKGASFVVRLPVAKQQ